MQAFLRFFFDRLFKPLLKILGTFFVEIKKIWFRIFVFLIFTKRMFLGFVYYTILNKILTYKLDVYGDYFVKVYNIIL